MKPIGTLLVAASLAASAATGAAASDRHGMGAGNCPGGMGMMGERQDMMRMMKRMHAMMGGGGMMGGHGMGGMMGGHGMGGLLPLLDADADDDGRVTAEELRARLGALLGEFDADGNGALSLDEFAALHAALMREKMVDRFQFLDNDGDGSVTAEEMTAPADRMARMEKRRKAMMERMKEHRAERRHGPMHGMGGMAPEEE